MRETDRTFRSLGIGRGGLRFCGGLGLAILLALACGSTARAQSSGSNGGQGQGQGDMHSHFPQSDLGSVAPEGDVDPSMAARRIRVLNMQRQKQIVSDSDKLLKIARELNDEVAAQNSSTLTPDELHKVAEIEKLARDVRQRMTEGAGQPQTIMTPAAPILFPGPSH